MNNFAFYGTGECDSSSQASATFARLVILAITVAALVFIFKKYISRGNSGSQKAIGALLSGAVVIAAAALYFVIYAAVACGR